MIKKFNHYRIFEDVNLSKKILNQKLEEYEKLRELLKKNEGWLGKFTEFLIKKNIGLDELENLYNELLELKSKNRKILINDKSYEQIWDLIDEEKSNLTINSFIKQLPSTQKKIIKDALKQSGTVKQRLITGINKIVNSENLDYFFDKVSRYKTLDSLLDAINTFSRSKDNSKETIISKVKELKNSEIVYDYDNYLITSIGNHSDLKELASDALWCTLSSNSIFKSYKSRGDQYILFDYNLPQIDPNFKIGFNFNENVVYAFNILDKTKVDYLKDLFKENNIDFKKLTIDKPDKDLKEIKLGSSTSKKDWLSVIRYLSEKELIKWIKKIINYEKTENFKIEVLSKMVKNLKVYSKEFITKQELEEIDEELINIGLTVRIIDTSKIPRPNSLPKNRWFRIAIEQGYFDDKTIIQSFSPSVLELADFNLRYHPKKSDEINNFYDYLLDKFLYLYNKDISVSPSDRGNRLDKIGVKYPKCFEVSILILSKYLNKETWGDFKDNYEEILNDETIKWQLKSSYKILFDDLELDLIKHPIREKNHINRIIKKDYLGFRKIITYNTFYKPKVGIEYHDKLLEHLKNNKLEFKITKKFIKELLSYKEDIENEELKKIREFFTNTDKKLVKNQEYQFNNLRIKIIN
jgi:hypothetical protein